MDDLWLLRRKRSLRLFAEDIREDGADFGSNDRHRIILYYLATRGNPWISNADYRRLAGIPRRAGTASRELARLARYGYLESNGYRRCARRYRIHESWVRVDERATEVATYTLSLIEDRNWHEEEPSLIPVGQPWLTRHKVRNAARKVVVLDLAIIRRLQFDLHHRSKLVLVHGHYLRQNYSGSPQL
jgi:hypothetical protein